MTRPTFTRFSALAVLLLGGAPLLGQLAGCSGPSPVDPTPSVTGSGPFGPLPTIFDPLADEPTGVGNETTLDLATWNLEFFPLRLPGDYDCPHPTDLTR